MDPFFTDLGRTILARWQAANFSLTKFPQIAKTALDENPPVDHVDLPALIREFLLNDEQRFQSNSGFGQPEIIVYDDPRFYIQILFWLDGTTQIHQHEFSGAFHVLGGSSIHSIFGFEDARSISAHFRVGDVQLKKTHFLPTGSTVPIISGGQYIHSLFHLESPSLTVVVRTHNDPGTSPQFTYLPPHLAIDPFFTDALTSRRCQLLDVLEHTGDPEYPDLVREMIGQLDFERGYFILQNGFDYLQSLGEWSDTWKAFQKKHRALSRYILPTLEETKWRDRVVRLRSSVSDVEHRFFLALLLNIPGKPEILKLVASHFDGAPIDNILRWSEELSEQTEDSFYILDAEWPEELGDPDPDLYFAAFRDFLAPTKAKSTSLPSLAPRDREVIRASFERSALRALVSP